METPQSSEMKLFVRDIPFNCSEAEFKSLFDTNKVVNTQLKKAKYYQDKNMGFGIITLNDKEMYEILQKNEPDNKYKIYGRQLHFEKYVNQRKYYQVSVRGLPKTFSENEIKNVFAVFGDVEYIKKFYDNEHNFNGTAVVIYNYYDSFLRAITQKTLRVVDKDEKINETLIEKNRRPIQYISHNETNQEVAKKHLQIQRRR
jgi:hypothetical protein